MTMPHSSEHTTCPLCGARAVLTFPDYKTRQMMHMCLECSYREGKYMGKGIEQWKWTWENFRSTGLKKVV